MKKDVVRTRIKAQKSLLSMEEKLDAASRAFELLEHTAAFMMANNILMYHSLDDELPTRQFISKWSNSKRFFLPRVNGLNLEILPYDRHNMRLGAFRIEEPTGDDVYDIRDIELVVVPGVAFDRNGNRVGRGKGYYDRLLRNTHATKIGVGFNFQVVEEIEADPHDIAMDIVITDGGIYRPEK